MEVNLNRHNFLLNRVCASALSHCGDLLFFACCVELNMSTRTGGGANSSLPGTPGEEAGSANRVLSWAVSFEKLLEDPCGVHHFTVSDTLSWRCLVSASRGACGHVFPLSAGLLEF